MRIKKQINSINICFFSLSKHIPESVIEAFVEKIVVSPDGFDWYLRFDGDPNDPLHLKTEGKKRKNSSVTTVGSFGYILKL